MRSAGALAVLAALALALVLVLTVIGIVAAGAWPRRDALAGRLGGHVGALEERLYREERRARQVDVAAHRRHIEVSFGHVLVDIAADARVRQVTIGRDRRVAETWQADPNDWPLEQARALASAWLPRDAAHRRSEPFVFRSVEAGVRDVYESAALRAVFSEAEYVRYGASGPPGWCTITYYLTESGGVAFALIGLY